MSVDNILPNSPKSPLKILVLRAALTLTLVICDYQYQLITSALWSITSIVCHLAVTSDIGVGTYLRGTARAIQLKVGRLK